MIEQGDNIVLLESPQQAEGESGLETTGFSSFGFGGSGQGTETSLVRKAARPTSVDFQWNYTGVVAQRGNPVPAAYWGTFITAFDGTILAGARNDGLGATTAPWSGFAPDPNVRTSDGAGGTTGLGTISSNVIGRPYSVGFDIFIDLLQTDVDINLNYYNPYTGIPATSAIVINKVPQVGQYSMALQPPTIAPFLIVRRRPEGYLSNEDGAQVFLSLPYASTTFPAGFVNPAAVGVPATGFLTRLLTNIVP